MPPEIQELIVSLAESQHEIDVKRKKQQKDLHDELCVYHELKNAWGNGYIRWSKGRQIKGFYVDLEKRKKEVFLGNTLWQAHRRLKHVKSFL